MPMPMVQIKTDVFAEIAHSVLDVQVVCSVIERYFDWSLIRKEKNLLKRLKGFICSESYSDVGDHNVLVLVSIFRKNRVHAVFAYSLGV